MARPTMKQWRQGLGPAPPGSPAVSVIVDLLQIQCLTPNRVTRIEAGPKKLSVVIEANRGHFVVHTRRAPVTYEGTDTNGNLLEGEIPADQKQPLRNVETITLYGRSPS